MRSLPGTSAGSKEVKVEAHAGGRCWQRETRSEKKLRRYRFISTDVFSAK